MKKMVYAVLAVLLLIGLMAGCKGNSDSEASPGTSGNSSEVKELNIEIMVPKFGKDPTDTLVQTEWQKAMEEYLGVKLNITWNRIQWGAEFFEKSKVMVAGGQIPDIMLTLGGASSINENGEKGLFADLAPYIDKYPYYKEFIKGTKKAEEYLYSENKKIFAFYDGYDNPTDMRPSQYDPAYRVDIFEKNNIKVPENADEFYDAAKKLKALYPDTFPVGSVSWELAYDGLFNYFHTSRNVYWNGEKFVFGPTDPNFKEAVEFLHKLYADNLVDPAFWTDGIDQARPKATTGKTFMYLNIWSGYPREFNQNKEANVKWANALPFDTKYGKGYLHSPEEAGKGLSNGSGIVISAKAKNLDLLAKMVDYQYSDKMIKLMNWGIEGKTYEEKDGKKQYIESIRNAENPPGEMEKYAVGTTTGNRAGIVWTPQDRYAKYFGPGLDVLFHHDGKTQLESSYFAANGTYGKDRIAPNDNAPRTVFSSDENEIISSTMTPVNTYVTESIVKFIKGDMNFSEWDKFISGIKKMGDYEKVVKIYNDKVK